MSELKVNKLSPESGTTLTLGDAGDTIVNNGTASGFLPTAGSSGNVLTSDGTNWASTAPAAAGFTQGTEQATTSGSSVTFGSIPAGVQMVFINFAGVSSSGVSQFAITIGDSGGLETSGYEVIGYNIDQLTLAKTAYSSSFGLLADNFTAAECNIRGHYILSLEDASNNTWCGSCSMFGYNQGLLLSSGDKTLSGPLTQVNIAALTGSFDAGAINIMYQ